LRRQQAGCKFATISVSLSYLANGRCPCKSFLKSTFFALAYPVQYAAMNILLLAPQPFYSERGTPIAILNLAKVLGEAGHQIDLVTFPGGVDVDIPNTTIIRTWTIPFIKKIPVGFSPQKILYDMLLFGISLRKVLTKRYDVIHSNEETIYIGMALAPLRRSKLIYDMDSSLSDQLVEKWPALNTVKGIFNWFEGLAVRRADRVIAVCPALREIAESYDENTPVDVLEDVIMDGGHHDDDAAEDLRRYLPDDGKLMLYVGNLEHYQGVDLVIEAMASGAIHEKLHFLVIGGMVEHDLERCKTLSHELGIADRVFFLGPRPVTHLMDYLEQADVLISPRTKGVNTPMKIYSYLGAGVPIVATDIPSHTQVLHDDNACTVEATPVALAEGINRVLDDEEYAQRLGWNAKQEAEERFSFNAFRKQLNSIYAQLEEQ